MALTIRLEIVSAEAEIFSGMVNSVAATGSEGELEIIFGHSQLLTRLKPGNIRAELANGEEMVLYVNGGILEIQPDIVSILADTAIRAEDLDEDAALDAKRKAEALLEDKHQGEVEYSDALAALSEAAAQLQAIRKLRKKVHIG